MRLISTNTLQLKKFNSLEEVLKEPCPRGVKQGYAILSHVWRHKGKPEQSFADMQKLCHSPRDVSPYDDERVDEKQHLGTKFGLADLLEEITGIDAEVLTFRRALHHVSVARRLSWAPKRKTTKIEDQAYSLLGIFGVSMATIYGEGRYAFRRLQYKILKSTADHTLFAWGDMWLPTDSASDSTLAENSTSKQDRRNPSSTPSKPHHFARPPRVEQCDSLFAPSPAEFCQAHTPDVISKTLEGVLAWARSVFDLGDPSIGVAEHRVAGSGVCCQFVIVPGYPFSLALLPCQNSKSNKFVALPLWPESPQESEGSGAHQLFRVGVSFTPSYPTVSPRLISLCNFGVQALRSHGWVPGKARSTVTDEAGRVYIIDPHRSSSFQDSRLYPLRLEPKWLYIPPWLTAYLAIHGLTLKLDDEARRGQHYPYVKPPCELYIYRKDQLDFVVRFDYCKRTPLLFALVDFTVSAARSTGPPEAKAPDEQGAYSGGPEIGYEVDSALLPRICHSAKRGERPDHVHVNAWLKGSMRYNSTDWEKEVRLSTTLWPTPKSSCLEIRFGGPYFASLRKLQAQAQARVSKSRTADSRDPSEKDSWPRHLPKDIASHRPRDVTAANLRGAPGLEASAAAPARRRASYSEAVTHRSAPVHPLPTIGKVGTTRS
ncbi:hypothetical protein VTO73DRAFT_1755 [Trametes versicolor]